jgi:SAM-dependent methyltransferase
MSTDADRAWFERLYAAADAGEADVPWDKGAPHHLLEGWARDRGISGGGRRADTWARDRGISAGGRRALVVGCGMGRDSEYLAGLGFATVAFDFSPTAIAAVRRRFPDSPVQYRVADLLDPPAEWAGAFDLVVESLTVQSLPRQFRPAAIARVRELVAPGGTLLVIAAVKDDGEDPPDGAGQDPPDGAGQDPPDGPWPLTRAEVVSFAAGDLELVRLEDFRDPDAHRWRAELRRPPAPQTRSRPT